MKTLAYIWNDELLSINLIKIVTIRLRVTTRMIQSVIEKSKVRGWKIEKTGMDVLSNLRRSCAIMTYTNDIYFVHGVLERLEIATINSDKTHDYYRCALEIGRQNNIAPRFIVFNSKTKITRMVESAPFAVVGKQTMGTGSASHFLARKLN